MRQPEPGRTLWWSLKAVELANLSNTTLAEAIRQANPGLRAGLPHPVPAYSFLRRSGLWVMTVW
jgi:hypothetical protein